MLPQSRGDGFRRRRHTAAPDQVVVLVDHCNRCFLERHIETEILLQFGPETCTSGWRWQGTPTIAALAIYAMFPTVTSLLVAAGVCPRGSNGYDRLDHGAFRVLLAEAQVPAQHFPKV